MWWTMWAVAEAACDADRAGVVGSAVAVEAAFARADAELVEAETAALEAAIPCVAERLGTTDVAAIYRAFGFGAFVSRDLDQARAWFASARAADPTYAIPAALLPERHPVRALYTEGSLGTVDKLRSKVVTYVDGREAGEVPVGRPYLLQRAEAEGVVTSLVRPWGVVEAPTDEERRAGASVGLLVGAGAQAGAAVFGDGSGLLRVGLPAGPLQVELGALARFASGPSDAGGRQLYLFPAGLVGLGWAGSGQLAPRFAVGGLLGPTANGVAAGPYGAVGLESRRGAWGWSAELRGGAAFAEQAAGFVGLGAGLCWGPG